MRPKERGARFGVGQQILTFLALVIGVKHKLSLAGASEQNHAPVRKAVSVQGGQVKRGRILNAGVNRLLHPGFQRGPRVVAKVCDVQRPLVVIRAAVQIHQSSDLDQRVSPSVDLISTKHVRCLRGPSKDNLA